MAEKERLDVLMVSRGLASSRELAKSYIMAGNVYVDGNKEDKAGTKFDIDSKIELRGAEMPYVSRGGYKLEKAMEVFPVSIEGKICMDIGASTGGFTDVMLQNGAKKVYSVDVGHDQLDEKLINNNKNKIKNVIDNKKNSFKDYNANAYSLIENNIFETKGENLILIIHEDNKNIETIINKNYK